MQTLLTPEEWTLLQDVFSAAAELNPGERSTFLDVACASSAALRVKVEALLASLDGETGVDRVIAGTAASALEAKLPRSGDRVGAFRITGVVGRGGMGVVYRAVRADNEYSSEVAIKVVAFGALNPGLRERFLRERQILASLGHPNIARLLDGGTTAEGVPYVVMELVEGDPLDAWCERHEAGRRERIALMIQVARAVDYAHRHLVVHRDLKPDNIHVTEEGVPKLLDFGIAKALDLDMDGMYGAVTIDASRIMTPEYASPEQVRGEVITTATDVYQLGVLLYLLLTGNKPFRGATGRMSELEQAICELPPPKPQLDADLDRIGLHALEKEPGRRYLSAGGLADDLERYLSGFPVRARTASWSYRASKFVLRHKVSVASGAVALCVLVGFGIAMAVQARRLERERNSAQQVSDFLATTFSSEDKNANLTQGKSLTARELLDQGAAHIDRETNLDPAVKDRLLTTLGHAYLSQGIYDRARDLYGQSLQLRRDLYGERSHEVAETMATMVDLDFFVEDYAAAEKDTDQWLAILQTIPGRNKAEMVQAVRTLAAVEYVRGDTKGAVDAARRAVTVAEQLYGEESYEAYDQYNPLGNVLGYVGDYVEEEKTYRAELKYLDHGPWQENPNVVLLLECETKLGFVLAREGQYAESEALLRRVVAERIQILGHAHDSTAASESALGFVLGKVGEIVEAESVGKQAMLDRAAHVGTSAMHYGTDEGLLASTYMEEGKYAPAEPLLRDQIALCRRHYGEQSLALARAMTELGRLQAAQKKYAAATTTLQDAMGMELRLNGDASPYAAADHAAVGELLMGEGRLGEAEASLRRAVAISETELGQAAKPIAGESLEALGAVLEREGRKQDAVPLLTEAVRLERSSLRAGTPRLARTEFLLAEARR